MDDPSEREEPADHGAEGDVDRRADADVDAGVDRGADADVDRGVDAGGGASPEDEAADRRVRREAQTLAARAALTPLGPDERPTPLVVAIAVCGLLALVVLVGALTVHDLARHGGSLPGAAFLAIMLALLAQGMYRRRYWAVLGFEGLLAFQILVTSLALVVASTLVAAALCLVSICLAGWLFWKLVRVMGRMQAGERR